MSDTQAKSKNEPCSDLKRKLFLTEIVGFTFMILFIITLMTLCLTAGGLYVSLEDKYHAEQLKYKNTTKLMSEATIWLNYESGFGAVYEEDLGNLGTFHRHQTPIDAHYLEIQIGTVDEVNYVVVENDVNTQKLLVDCEVIHLEDWDEVCRLIVLKKG